MEDGASRSREMSSVWDLLRQLPILSHSSCSPTSWQTVMSLRGSPGPKAIRLDGGGVVVRTELDDCDVDRETPELLFVDGYLNRE